MSHLATEKQMISDVPSVVHLCSLCVHTGHLQPQELSWRGLSGAHQRVSTLQRLKPQLADSKHDLHQTSKVLRYPETEAKTVLTIPWSSNSCTSTRKHVKEVEVSFNLFHRSGAAAEEQTFREPQLVKLSLHSA